MIGMKSRPITLDHMAKKRKEISAIETLTVRGAKGRAVRRRRSEG